MKKIYLFILTVVCCNISLWAQQKKVISDVKDSASIIDIFQNDMDSAASTQQNLFADTTQIIKEEDAIIDDIVEKRVVPKEDKIQYFSKLTRYGFKNLFTNYAYNNAMPYSTQVNPYAEKYMQSYLKNHGKSLLSMKSWGTPYFNLIDHILTQYGVPKELKYLAVIESGLQSSATSWVGAGGPWQFMPYTARDYGLIVSANYDERRDYVKSTHAAARYLLSLYKQFKDWLLVIAAYNGGPGRVISAIQKSGSKNFWALQHYLPEESKNHVKKFIATHYIMEAGGNNQKSFNTNVPAATIGFNPTLASTTNPTAAINPYNNKPVLTETEMANAETEMITGKYNAVVVAKHIQMDMATFNRYNPGFEQQIQANGKYELILPQEQMNLFRSKKYEILNESVFLLLQGGSDNIPKPKTTSAKQTYKYKKSK